jgi:hypothetical protein
LRPRPRTLLAQHTHTPLLTRKEKNAKHMREKWAEQRAERVAKGADIPAEPLAPIEHRRLLNSLQAKLATLSTSFEVVHVRLRTDIRFAPLRLNFQ